MSKEKAIEEAKAVIDKFELLKNQIFNWELEALTDNGRINIRRNEKLEAIEIKEATTEAVSKAMEVLKQEFFEGRYNIAFGEWQFESEKVARCYIHINDEPIPIAVTQYLMILHVKNWKSIEERS